MKLGVSKTRRQPPPLNSVSRGCNVRREVVPPAPGRPAYTASKGAATSDVAAPPTQERRTQ